ncbi:MAG: FecR domain-containing protein [Pseudomonadota bacterium]|nr:FecR domain-containing protein [Pseudomonadota bacterium]
MTIVNYFRIVGIATLLVLPFSSLASDNAARVVNIEGVVSVVRSGNTTPITRGEALLKSDRVTTGENSSIELKLLDGSLINLGELADLTITELVYDPIKKDGFNDLKIATGAFRLISGSIAKLGPDLMKLDTPVATIGIRGTSLVGKASQVGSENHVILVADPNGYVGEVVVENSSGVVTLSKKGEGVTLKNPTEPIERKAFPTEFIEKIAEQVPEIKYEDIQDRQFRSLFWFNE